MYKNNKEEDEKLESIQIIKERRHSELNNLEIQNFIRNYRVENNRNPSSEEIYDNLEDQVNKKYIDQFVKRLHNKIDNSL